MFKKLMVPVDLMHPDILSKALDVSANLSKTYNAPIVYVGVTEEAPTSVAHNPSEFQRKMAAFAQQQSEKYGIAAEGIGYTCGDPATDMNETLLKASEDIDADLIVIASHVPTFADRLWSSHGGGVASRSKKSVMVLR
ncbi:universal stress protein [Pseudovibrio exalbescens]|uniref:Universal stress protein UspA n=1 Tax=Pseudovibrio exalbescens TaxID=197461 RepID=A0A1U7JKW2_9HYPH|nr:universal stress protein [Pseudovibrio exalbescens]OKL45357.1 universal stress protein UspA [Pseudovibrio exalbescens]